jgi:hypothetical protein
MPPAVAGGAVDDDALGLDAPQAAATDASAISAAPSVMTRAFRMSTPLSGRARQEQRVAIRCLFDLNGTYLYRRQRRRA